MRKEYRQIAFTDYHVKHDDDSMTIEGYGSVFGNADHYNDIVERGAFVESIKSGRKVKMLLQHDVRAIIGVWQHLHEDAKGLYMKGKFSNTSAGRDTYELVKDGALDGLSIGFTMPKDGYEYDKDNVRLLKKIDLHEVSLVTFPANEEAFITSVKSDLPTNIRDFERLLRTTGLGDDMCKLIASKSWNHLGHCRDGNGLDSGCRDGNGQDVKNYVDNINQILTNNQKGICHGSERIT